MKFAGSLDKRETAGKLFMSAAAVSLLFVAIAVVTIFPMCDFDTFWHVANGRAMVASGHIVNEEIFSYTAKGTPFSNHEWLAQILMFLVYDQWGTSGLIGMKVAITLIVCWILYLTARLFGARPAVAALLCLFVVLAGLTRFRERPLLFSFLGVALLQFLLYGYCTGRFGIRALYFIPPVMVFWDYLHGAVYGLLFLAAFVAGESIKGALKKFFRGADAMTGKRLRALWMWTGITLLCMLLNPYGLRSYDIFMQFVRGASAMVSLTVEFLPTPWKGYLLFWSLFALTCLTLLWQGKRINITHLFIIIPFGYLAVRYTRGMEAFDLVALPILAANTARLFDEHNKKGLMKFGINVFITLAVITGIGYAGYYKFLAPKHKFSFGYGLNENSFPIGSVRFIKAVNVEGNMYNTDGFGGYLSYFLAPERKIFYYSHHVAFKAVEDYLHDSAALDRCNINYAIVGREEELDMFLRKGFVPVYWEPSSIVLVRNNEQNRELINHYAIRFFQPLMKDADIRSLAADYRVFPVLAREIGTYLAYRTDHRIADLFSELILHPNAGLPDSGRTSLLKMADRYNGDNARLLASLGVMYYKEKHLGLALKKFTRALEIDQEATGVRLNLAYVYFDMGNYQKAEGEFERLLSKNSLDADAVYGLALTSYRTARYGRARELFRKYLSLVPGGPWAENARTLLSDIK